MNIWTQSEDNIWVAAHRGLSMKYPENTMLSFRKAMECPGLNQIETDVRITRDGELVLIHDETVDRTTDGTGLVREKTLGELKGLDAGSIKGPEFKGEQIPTFIEFMDYVKQFDNITLDLELKEYPVDGREEIAFSVANRVMKIVDDYGFTDRVVLNTFNGALQEYLYEKYGKKIKQHVYYPINYMGKKFKYNPYTEYAYCCCVFRSGYFPINIGDEHDFQKLKDLGVDTWAGAGVKDEWGVDEAIKRGATLITCDNCDDILEILRKKGKHQ